MAAWAGGEEPAELLASFAEESGYRTPKVDVRGVVLDAERLLLVREPESDGWCLPGGWADVGETPSHAVEKEVAEEAGVAVRAVRLLGVFDRDFRGRLRWPAHVYKLYSSASRWAGHRRPTGSRPRRRSTFRSTLSHALREDPARAAHARARRRARPPRARGVRLVGGARRACTRAGRACARAAAGAAPRPRSPKRNGAGSVSTSLADRASRGNVRRIGGSASAPERRRPRSSTTCTAASRRVRGRSRSSTSPVAERMGATRTPRRASPSARRLQIPQSAS